MSLRPIGQFVLMGPEDKLRANRSANGVTGGLERGAEGDGANVAANPATHASGGDAPCPFVEVRLFNPPARFDGCFSAFYHLTLDFEPPAGAGQRPALPLPSSGSSPRPGPATPAPDPMVEDYIQPGWATLRFFKGAVPSSQIAGTQLKGAHFTVNGPSSLPCRFELSRTQMWGVGLFPLGWARFVEADACDFTNRVFDGAKDPVFERFDGLPIGLRDAGQTLDEQFEAIITSLGQIMSPTRDDAKIRRVHSVLMSGKYAAVGELADTCGMSIRTLERVCLRYFGFTPKLLLRRQRFLRSLRNFILHQSQGRAGFWTEAMDEEYHDQAQFTREFTEFMLMTPSIYAGLDHPVLTAFIKARAQHRAAQKQGSATETG